jgi:hypothetical protein
VPVVLTKGEKHGLMLLYICTWQGYARKYSSVLFFANEVAVHGAAVLLLYREKERAYKKIATPVSRLT